MKLRTTTNVLAVFALVQLLAAIVPAAQFNPPIVVESPAPNERDGSESRPVCPM
jgi:hypothetical protein